MKKETKIFLGHILDSIEIIEKHSKKMTKEKFSKDLKTQDAVIRRIEIIGEAARNISADFRKSHRETEWKEIAGMRDKLIHEYFGVDIDVVWKTLKKDIPKLKKQILKLL